MSAALDMTPPSTLEEFLDWEPYQELRYEWDGVQPIAVAGGAGSTFAHAELASRLCDALRAQPRSSSRTVVHGGLKVMTAGRSRARCPDLVVTCSPIGRADDEVPDPVLIVEVLSDATAVMDRGVKLVEYAELPSLRRYVMLDQDEPLARVCAREDGFAERRVRGVLHLPEFDLSVPLSDLYDGLT